jgi:peroxiredoxin
VLRDHTALVQGRNPGLLCLGLAQDTSDEFIAFAKRHADFQAINCELLGLSIDSHYSHIAWERNIKRSLASISDSRSSLILRCRWPKPMA